MRRFFHVCHDAEGITAVNFPNVHRRIALFEQSTREVEKFGDVLEADGDAGHTIEIAADTHRFNTGDFHYVVNVGNHIAESSRWNFRALLLCQSLDCGVLLFRIALIFFLNSANSGP